MSAVRVPMLWLCGASGAGKSTVGWEVFGQLRTGGVRSAYLDLDQIGFCLPAPPDDPENHRVKAANLAAMWPAFRAAGARCLVISGIVTSQAVVRAHAEAVPQLTVTVCRLRASHGVLRERIFLRGRGGGPAIPGDDLRGQPPEHLVRAVAESIREADAMERDGIGDVCVDTDGLAVAEVARRVRAAAGGWPRLPPTV